MAGETIPATPVLQDVAIFLAASVTAEAARQRLAKLPTGTVDLSRLAGVTKDPTQALTVLTVVQRLKALRQRIGRRLRNVDACLAEATALAAPLEEATGLRLSAARTMTAEDATVLPPPQACYCWIPQRCPRCGYYLRAPTRDTVEIGQVRYRALASGEVCGADRHRIRFRASPDVACLKCFRRLPRTRMLV